MTGPVAVIITARNAEATIGDAVQSALGEPEVAEVMVVDDASTDATGATARTAAAGDKRLVVLRQEVNIGPAAARNLAIAQSTAPFIAILDADDYLLPGRFAQLLCHAEWDIIADNIVFVPESTPGRIDPKTLPRATSGSEPIDLEGFVQGNISHRAVKRGELGFLKPVIRRSILLNGLVYDPALWLGEDYDLYIRLLLQGARFRLTRQIGYAARVRANSLSGQHRTGDLYALLGATSRHIAAAVSFPAAQAAMRRHQRQVRDRYLLRSFLDRKATDGVGQAAKFALSSPSSLWPIAGGILSDKLASLLSTKHETLPPQRVLLPVQRSSAV
ncbi:glycosyltransferase family 2 protein [Tabrizicola piscis]|uniref:Glycosyltransferase family 2 protein n=1 Tax=Tabrizicola piscis TaxID=2494374 RepID=A0A3S8U3E9_9RHOB|nr:glycosyltransferase family 2 protein [Tabrizicola piscis]AZL58137.1 glycosyltransferase family 2 protein [Tabrizicola piscis]